MDNSIVRRPTPPSGFSYTDPASSNPAPAAAAPVVIKRPPAPAGFSYSPAAAVERPASAETGHFMRGLKTSAHQLPQFAGGAVALGGDALAHASKSLGGDGSVGKAVMDYGMGVYKDHEKDTKQLSKDSDSLSHVIKNPREIGSWLKYNAGYMGGQMLESAAAMGIGAVAGSEVPGAGNVAGAVVGAVARPALEKMVLKKTIALMAEKGLSEEAAGIAAKTAVKKSLGAQAGGVIAAGAMNLGQEAGSIYPEARDQAEKEGRDLTGGDLVRVGGSALAAAGVDTAFEKFQLFRMFKGLKPIEQTAENSAKSALRRRAEATAKSALRRRAEATGKEMLEQGVGGGATELAQTAIERFGAQQALTGDEAMTDYVDSAGAGLVGGFMGGSGTALHTQKADSGPLGRVANAAGEQAVAQAGAVAGGAAPDGSGPTPDNGSTGPDDTGPAPAVPAADLMQRAQRRLDRLNQKLNGSEPVASVDAAGNTVMIPGAPAESMSKDEEQEHAFLTQNVQNPEALAQRVGVKLADDQPAASRAPAAPKGGGSAPVSSITAPGAPKPMVPWVDTTTGEIGAPTDDQLTGALADRLTWQYNNAGHMKIPAKALATEWGVTSTQLNRVKKAASAQSVATLRAEQGAPSTSAPATPADVSAPQTAAFATPATESATAVPSSPAIAKPTAATATATATPAEASHGDAFPDDVSAIQSIGAAQPAPAPEAPAPVTNPSVAAEPTVQALAPAVAAPPPATSQGSNYAQRRRDRMDRISSATTEAEAQAIRDNEERQDAGSSPEAFMSMQNAVDARSRALKREAKASKATTDAVTTEDSSSVATPAPATGKESLQVAPEGSAQQAQPDRAKTTLGAFDESPAQGLSLLSADELRAVAASTGKKFSPKAKAATMVENMAKGGHAELHTKYRAAVAKVLADGAPAVITDSLTTAAKKPGEALAIDGLKKDRVFRALLKASGDPSIDSPSAAEFAEGYADQKAGRAINDARLPAESTTQRATGDNSFDPVNFYLSGYKAAKTGKPASIRSSQARAEAYSLSLPPKTEQSPDDSGTATPPAADRGADLAAKVEAAAREAATHPENDKVDPTEGQKEAGNYGKGHVSVQGLDVSIENPRGSTRSGVGEAGKPWSHTMTDHYGYVRGTVGADGEHVDVYVGPNPASDQVFNIDQIDQKTGKFDEHKVMLGFDTQAEAIAAYSSNFDPGWKVGTVTPMSMGTFKGWLREGDTSKPMAAPSKSAAASKSKPESAPVNAEAAPVKWFGTQDKADAYIAKKGLGATHQVVQNGKRFEIQEKAPVDGGSKTLEERIAAWQSKLDTLNEKRAGAEKIGNGWAYDKEIAATERTLADYKAAAARNKAGDTKPPPSDAFDTTRFADNKIFTADKVAAAHARLKAKLGTLNSGIDPEVLVDGMTIAGAYIEGGIRKFKDYAGEMVGAFGDGIKPYLLTFYEAVRHYPGVDTKGMDPLDVATREHEAILDPVDMESPAVGNAKPPVKKRAKATTPAGELRLKDDFGTDQINGYPDRSGRREEGNDTKDAFLKDAQAYLKAVASLLDEHGFTVTVNAKGKPNRAVSANESGMAGAGDVSLRMVSPAGTGIYVHVSDSSLRGVVPTTTSGIALMYRTTDANHNKSGTNQWGRVDLTAAELGAELLAHAERNPVAVESARTPAYTAPKTEVSTDDTQGNPSADGQARSDVGSVDPSRVPGARSGRGTPAQSGAAKADSGRVEAGQPQDDGATDRGKPDISGAAGEGAASSNVENAGGSASGRDGLHGLDGNGGTRNADDGARSGSGSNGRSGGSAGSVTPEGKAKAAAAKKNPEVVKPPAEVSPANPGVGNFHYANPLEIVGGGQVARFNKNRDAIELLNQLRDESRKPTQEEQAKLAGYTGWGSFGQELFQGTWDRPQPKEAWEARDAWLRQNMSQSEWESLQRSITNAHYTDPPTVLAMWSMIQRMGFTGGRVLEPSMGIGNFFGMMPADLANRSTLSGIELDETTGAMAQMLYPASNVKVMGYQDSKTPDNFHDVIVGNWPFENTPIADRRYQRLNPMVHDYFFLKTLDQVRPGGLVVAITSAGTMDKKNSAIRTELARKGDLVAAFRLPTGAFQQYAGTKVVTDIIILRKRPEAIGNPMEEGWIDSKEHATPAGTPVFINEYYHTHPDHVVGTIDFGYGTTSGREGMIVHRPDDMEAQLQRIAGMVPEGAYKTSTRADTISYVTNHTADREGALTIADGKLMIVRGEQLAPAAQVLPYELKDAKKTASRVDQLTHLVDMRGHYATLIDAERSGKGDPEVARKALKKSYDAFTKAHGTLNDSFGMGWLKKVKDPFYPALAALEIPVSGRGKTAKYRQSKILTESTTRAKATLKNPSVTDAFVIARNSAVNPSLAEIAAIAGKSEAEVKAELIGKGSIYELPSGDVVPSDMYLSGNVREKMREAKAAVEIQGNTALQRNIDALAKVIPADVPYYKIETQLGATWVSTGHYQQYIAHMLGMDNTDGIDVSFAGGRWRVTLDKKLKNRPEYTASFGSKHASFRALMQAAMSNQLITVRERDEDKNLVVNDAKTKELTEKITNIRDGFGDWLWGDTERRVAVEREYNDARNAYADPTFDGSFLDFEGMALSLGRGPFNLREHQVNAIWRALVMRKSLNAHEVGTGKAQPLDAKLLTPSGWKLMGDIAVGDEVITQSGESTRVEAVFPQGQKEILRVTFNDGSVTECCDEHLWLTQTYKERNFAQRSAALGKNWDCGKAKVRSLADIRTTLVSEHLAAKNHSIPIVEAVRFDHRENPLDPYLLGILLGDGSMTHKSVTLSGTDADILADVPLPNNVEWRKIATAEKCPTWRLTMVKQSGFGANKAANPVVEALAEMGLMGTRSHSKFVPDSYKFNDVAGRVALLQGLLDTDGTVSNNGISVTFTTVSPALAQDVRFLVQSLGGTVKTSSRIPGYTHNGERRLGVRAYTLSLCLPPQIAPFRLPRKAAIVKVKTKYLPARYIVAVDRVGVKEAQCIRVADASHLYVTDDFIVTHNTFTMGGIAVESRRYGIAKKPLIMAHNANSKSVAAEIQQMYPGAKVLYIDNLAPGEIDVRLRQIANDDWDAIVMPHSLIDRLSFKEETLMALAKEEIAELEQVAKEAAEDDDVTITDEMWNDEEALKKLRSPTAKELVKMRNRIIATIKKQAIAASREGALSFEELGIDMIMVDEAHEFKKPPFSTKMKMKGLQTQASNKSIALNFMTKYVRANNNGGNVHLFTGTPITNTMTEVFHMMRYIMQEEMQGISVDQWDGWFGSFARSVEDVELSAAAEYEQVTRLSEFINVPELRRMIGQYMDVVFSDDMPEMVPRKTASGKTMADTLTDAEQRDLLNGRTEGAKDRPYKKVIVDTADLTPSQESAFEQIQGYARSWRKMSKKERKEAMLSGSPESPIVTEGLAAKSSLDSRLLHGEMLAGQEGKARDDDKSKASRAVNNLLEIYHSHPLANQVVFTNLGMGTTASRSVGEIGKKTRQSYKVFSTVRDIMARLEAAGIPRDQIALVDGSTNKDKRKEIADKMKTGEIRIVFGSSQSLGVGVNMQDNLRAMHHLDAPYMPGDLEQRNGRGQRQGNQWNTVLEHRYLTDRLDGRRWQILAIKDRFIKRFLKSNDEDRVIDGDGASDEESDILSTFAEAAGDPRILIREKLKKKIDRLKSRERMHGVAMADNQSSIRKLGHRMDTDKGTLARIERDKAMEQAAVVMTANAGTKFTMKVDGRGYDKRSDADAAITKWAGENVITGARRVTMGEFGGHKVYIRLGSFDKNYTLSMEFGDTEIIGPAGSVASIETALRNFPAKVDAIRASIEEAKQSRERMQKTVGEPFHMADKLATQVKALDDLEKDIVANPVPPPAWLRSGAPVGTDTFYKGKDYLVTGHRWTDDGWFVMGERDGKETAIPYDEAKDAQGMVLYEPREFKAAKVLTEAERKAKDAAGNPVEGKPSFSLPDATGPLFRAGTAPAGAVSTSVAQLRKVNAIAKEATAKWGPNQPRVRVVHSADMLPDGAKQNPRYREGKGLYDGNTVWLVASNLHGRDDVLTTLAHEAVGHYGLDRVMGDAAWRDLTGRVEALRKDPSKASARIRDVLQEVERRYRSETGQRADATTFAREFMAVSAEKGVNHSMLDRVIAAVRAWLRKIMPSLKLSDREIRALLARSDAYLRTKSAGAVVASRQAAAAFDRNGDPFYSALNEAVEQGKGMPRKADATAWSQWLDGAARRGEFKNAEREWMGVDAWLKEQAGPVTREQLQAFVRDNQVRVQDVTLGQETDAKFASYQLPGGSNYKELLLTLPAKAVEADPWGYGDILAQQRDDLIENSGFSEEAVNAAADALDSYGPIEQAINGMRNSGEYDAAELLQALVESSGASVGGGDTFISGHFNQPNILAHVRFNERTDADGKRVLFLEEVQSDWHQAGRKDGYGNKWVVRYAGSQSDKPVGVYASEAEARAKTAELNDAVPEDNYGYDYENENNVPDAPFKGTQQWSMLAFKRMARYAAENGFDRIGWTTGKQQAERYDLSKQVDSVFAKKEGPDSFAVTIEDMNGNTVMDTGGANITAADLENHIGKELAKKIVDEADQHAGGKTYSGLDLKVGGEGMKSFYDKMLPSEVNKWGKAFGAKVGESFINLSPAHEGNDNDSGPAESYHVTRNGDTYQVRNQDGVIEATHDNLDDAEEQATEFTLSAKPPTQHPDKMSTVHSIDITPKMRETALAGLPLFSFAGEGAMTADRRALLQAQQMEAMGRDSVPDRFGNLPGSPDDTHVATGWHRGVDGKWRWEIDDSAAKLLPLPVGRVQNLRSLSDALDHPALFAAYPKLAQIQVRTEPGLKSRGHFDPSTNTISMRDAAGYEATGDKSMKSVLLHEVQHVIQTAEGWARGGNLSDAKTMPEFQALLAKETAEGYTDAEYRAAMRVYARLAGEVEARNTQTRMNMPAGDRRDVPPSFTADRTRSEQIVRFNRRSGVGDRSNGGASSNISEMNADETVKLYHGGGRDLKEIKGGSGPGNTFGGLFAATDVDKARSHGVGAVYEMDVLAKDVLTQHGIDYQIDHKKADKALRDAMPWLDDADFDTAYRAVVDDRSNTIADDDMTRIFREDTVGEASWEAQRIRGEVARLLGYKAVEMDDEHGTSYLVLPGTKVRPVVDGNVLMENREDDDPDKPRKKRDFSNAAKSIERIGTELPQLDRGAFQQAKDWLSGKARDLEPFALGALQLRHVLELASDNKVLAKPAKAYSNLYQRMDGDRNSMTIEGAAKVDALNEWARQPGLAGWRGKQRPEATALFKFMHAVTQLAVDPTDDYKRLLMRDAGNEYKPWTKDLIKERMRILRETALTRSGDDKTRLIDEIKELQSLPAREKAREQRYPELVREWNKLSPEAQHHFTVMRDYYKSQSEALEQAVLDQLKGLDIPDAARRSALRMVADNFAQSKVDGVYFPLGRFGDYWLSLERADGDYVFAKYETADAMKQAQKQFIAEGATIMASGRQDNNYRAKDAPSGTFIGDLMGVLKNAPDKVKDEIYQMYLRTLPSVSLKKHGIHRNNVAGYSDDVPRVFAGSVFHGAHQISKARYGWQMQATMEQLRERMEAQRTVIDADQAAHGDALISELVKRHDWIMNPTNSKLSNVATSVGFTWFLGASPASALVNLIQVPQIVLPVLGAHHGWGPASSALTKAMKEAVRTGGNIDKVLKGEDMDAFRALQKQGTFQRTATHALAGVAEGDSLRSSPVYTRVMTAVSWMFHKSEVVNREATGMAAFRLARASGKSFDQAIDYADEITNGTHGDYSNANRARYMQGNVQKVVLQFKNYSLSMSWLWGRNFHQAFKGDTPEVRALARRTLTGMTGMTALFAGVVGLPMFNLLRYSAEALHVVTGDDDEPWDFLTEFRSWLAEHLGETAASIIADGAANQAGANVASRVSMSDLWFRSSDRQLEGTEAYHNMLESLAGPMGGLIKNLYVGAQRFNEGHVERGIETMLPTFAKNAVKAVRYAHEGVNSMRGDPIVQDVGARDLVVQALGFQPTHVAEQYRINNALFTYQRSIQDRHQALMNAYAMAAIAGDEEGRGVAAQKIQAFNAKYPEIAIRTSNLRASLRQRARLSQQSENGIMLNKKLAARVKAEVGALVGEQ